VHSQHPAIFSLSLCLLALTSFTVPTLEAGTKNKLGHVFGTNSKKEIGLHVW